MVASKRAEKLGDKMYMLRSLKTQLRCTERTRNSLWLPWKQSILFCSLRAEIRGKPTKNLILQVAETKHTLYPHLTWHFKLMWGHQLGRNGMLELRMGHICRLWCNWVSWTPKFCEMPLQRETYFPLPSAEVIFPLSADIDGLPWGKCHGGHCWSCFQVTPTTSQSF